MCDDDEFPHIAKSQPPCVQKRTHEWHSIHFMLLTKYLAILAVGLVGRDFKETILDHASSPPPAPGLKSVEPTDPRVQRPKAPAKVLLGPQQGVNSFSASSSALRHR